MDGLGSPGACTVASVMFQIFVTLWTVAHQVPLSLGLSRKEYWNGLPCPPPEDLLDSGVEPVFLVSPALADGGSLPLVPPGKPLEGIMLSEISQIEKGKYCMLSLMCGI